MLSIVCNLNTTQIGGVAESHRLNTQTDFKGSVSPPKSFVRVSLRVTCSLWDHVCYIVTFVYRCANIFTHSADGKSSQIPLAEKREKGITFGLPLQRDGSSQLKCFLVCCKPPSTVFVCLQRACDSYAK